MTLCNARLHVGIQLCGWFKEKGSFSERGKRVVVGWWQLYGVVPLYSTCNQKQEQTIPLIIVI